MLDFVLTIFAIACTATGLMYYTFLMLNWFMQQEHRRNLEDRKSLKEYLRQDKEDGNECT